MPLIYFHGSPFDKSAIALALESGVDGVIVPADKVALVSGLSRCEVFAEEDTPFLAINSKSDEEEAIARIRKGERIVLAQGWEVIPVENLLAQSDNFLAEAENPEKAKLASGILEKGVSGIVIPAQGVNFIKEIVKICKTAQKNEELLTAHITRIQRAGLGHRVCLDTMTLMHRGQGMLVGNSSAFTFLVHAETEHNEYVAARPFRVNAGAVHAYARLPNDKTSYLGELKAGDELLVVDYQGNTSIATLGRIKIEIRPMLLIEAEATDLNGKKHTGAIFLQNAETIRLTGPGGEPLSVVSLKPGDEVLCRIDQAGRHFGMKISEDIQEH